MDLETLLFGPDFTGHVIGRLTVVRLSDHKDNGGRLWECLCACGNTTFVRSGKLRRAAIKSCGCRKRDVTYKSHKLYGTWQSMLHRCANPSARNYKHYGGRGISVCDRWRNSFGAFCDDMGDRPDGTTLDRINNDGNYEPSNCRWATPIEQNNNTRWNRLVTAYGKTMTLAEWSRQTGVDQRVIASRTRRGVSGEIAVATPSGGFRRRENA